MCDPNAGRRRRAAAAASSKDTAAIQSSLINGVHDVTTNGAAAQQVRENGNSSSTTTTTRMSQENGTSGGSPPKTQVREATTTDSSAVDKSNWKVDETPQDSSFVPTLAVTLWLGWICFNAFVPFLFLICPSIKIRMVLVGVCAISLALPRHFPGKLGKIIARWMLKNAEKYFGMKTTFEDEDALKAYYNEKKAVIYTLEPHDILPYGVFAFSPLVARSEAFAGNEALMTGAVFSVPIVRQVYSWVGCSPVAKKVFQKRLERGQSLVFVPGGVQEVTMMDPAKPDDVLLFMKNRKGFVKMALKHGSPIVPAFGFGHDGSFDYWFPRGKFFDYISRKAGIAPVLFLGRYGIPFGIPKPKKIHIVVGKPIAIPNEGDEVSMESIERYHALVVEEMIALYNRHKDDAGYGDRKLVVV